MALLLYTSEDQLPSWVLHSQTKSQVCLNPITNDMSLTWKVTRFEWELFHSWALNINDVTGDVNLINHDMVCFQRNNI